MDLIPNETILPMWVIFVATFMVLKSLVFRPTLEIINKRSQMTEGLHKEMEYFQEQAEVHFKKYESLMTDAKNLARSERESILRVADQEQRGVIAEARKEASQKLDDVKAAIDSEVSAAKGQIQQQSTQLADEIAAKLMGRAA